MRATRRCAIHEGPNSWISSWTRASSAGQMCCRKVDQTGSLTKRTIHRHTTVVSLVLEAPTRSTLSRRHDTLHRRVRS